MAYTEIDHPEVQQETLEIARHRKQFRRVFWLSLMVALVVNAALLSVLVAAVLCFFGEIAQIATVAITCTAYLCAVLGVAIAELKHRVDRIEMHALTLHNEVQPADDW